MGANEARILVDCSRAPVCARVLGRGSTEGSGKEIGGDGAVLTPCGRRAYTFCGPYCRRLQDKSEIHAGGHNWRKPRRTLVMGGAQRLDEQEHGRGHAGGLFASSG